MPSRSAAASPINGIRNPQQARSLLTRTVSDSRLNRRNRALEDVATDSSGSGLRNQVNIHTSSGNDFTIRGQAAPPKTIVVAQNFARGTTAADIESVMLSFAEDVQCRLVTASPTVIAELTFADRDAAEQVVAQFNNKMVCIKAFSRC